MMQQQTLSIVLGLLAKTEAGEARWIEPNDILASLFKGFVRLELPRSSLSIGLTKSDSIQFKIYNSDGIAVIDEAVRPDEPGHSELQKILELTTRRTRKVEETMSDIHAFLHNVERNSR